ncbi:MAG TPA: S8 family serine peptidase [Thermoanaerobaculia bacterium]|nr:S8 family serine peptidase [Thermoanaerobaculia bacterium]
MRKFLPILFLLAATASANDLTVRSMQSGGSTTPIHDRGIHGEGQIIAILDTGADWTICHLAEPDGSRPPINTGTPAGGLEWQNLDLTRRKIIAYNFLYSCKQYPGAPACDDPARPEDYYDSETGHGTHAATTAAGDRGTPIVHDSGDAIAPAAKLVIQDGGFLESDLCTFRPGFGCPVNMTPILDQAYRQGVRIHSNSWGDRQGSEQGSAPAANYPQSAFDVDAFVWSHPDMLVVFNTGNYMGSDPFPPASSLSAPGSAKNTLQVGGTRAWQGYGDNVLAGYSLVGPARDGRIKPDVVGPAFVRAGDAVLWAGSTCGATPQPGTSWASPSVAGAAALVRQYYVDGFYPTGMRNAADSFTPSAALLKATIIAAARPVPQRLSAFLSLVPAAPVPSFEQGWGFPVLDDVLHFQGDARRLRVYDVPLDRGLAVSGSFTTTVKARPGTELKAVLVWTDPPGHVAGVSDMAPQLVNDLDLRVITPAGETVGGTDRLNNVEVVSIGSPADGVYTVQVSASRLGSGPRQGYALVLTGDFEPNAARRRAVGR